MNTKPNHRTAPQPLLRALLIGLALLAFAPFARAQTDHDEIPPELRPWIPWVTASLTDQACASLGERKVCQWPGLLELDLGPSGGQFRLYVDVDASSTRPIVGEHGAWPQSVQVNGKAVPVLRTGDLPAVLLDPGRHVVTGRFAWKDLPETLEVGPDTALVHLTMQGVRVPLVKREGSELWLKGLGTTGNVEQEQEQEQVELSVVRQIRDGVPLIIETRLYFHVAGKARELTLPAPLLPDTVPLGVQADLALALEPSGDLRIQLLPGRHEVTLLARHLKQDGPLTNVERPSPWPKKETWSFHPQPELRTVELSGLPGIDASRTELPEAWQKDGAYVASADAQLVLRTMRRGQEQVRDNQMNLEREFWLDEGAAAFTIRDRISGEMNHDFRLSLLSGSLGNVSIGDESLVITEAHGTRGVELRDTTLELTAVSRLARQHRMSAVGWSEDAQSLRARLYLPPGWEVLFTSGVDSTSRTWLARWDLFDVFYLLLVSFGMWRLLGPLAGVIAAVALALCRGESGAPEYLWLPLLAFAALLHLLSPGRFRSWLSVLFSITALITIVVLVAFSVQQVRHALYPHLDRDFFDPGISQGFALGGNASPAEAPADPVAQSDEDLRMKEQSTKVAAPESASASKSRFLKKTLLSDGGEEETKSSTGYAQQQFHPDAVAQTGPGIPEAGGEPIQLSWSGPVARDHELTLYLLSPSVSRLLTVLRLSALWGLVYLLFRFTRSSPGLSAGLSLKRATSAAAAVLLLIVSTPRLASADEPSDARLAELRARLTRAPTCAPDCVFVSHMQIQLRERLRITSDVHAGGRGIYRLPGPAKDLYDQTVLINGDPATALRLEQDGAFYLRLDEGVHSVILDAKLPRDRATLDVGTAPEVIQIEAQGWSVSGVNQQGRATGGTLTFQREASFSPANPAHEPSPSAIAVPPFFSVQRLISLGVTSSVSTRIVRSSDASSPEVLHLPLLPGEQVTTPGVDVRNGVAELSFPREEALRTLTSTLQLPPDGGSYDLSLSAPAATERTESWLIECGVVYRCQTEGLVASSRKSDGRALWTFAPFPGDKLTVHATLPKPAEGATVTVHKATSTWTPGSRTGRGRLELVIQSSRSVVHAISIPKDSKLEVVRVGDVPQAVKSEDGQVRVALAPGRSLVTVEWQERQGIGAWFSPPAVHTGAAGVNFRTIVELPQNRWLLAAGGPGQGPALLFWGYLVLIFVAALLLPRLPSSPLTWSQWLLLGLGLTQVPAAVAVFVAGWFFAIAARRSLPKMGRGTKNLIQLALIFYTLLFLSSLTGAVYEGLISSPDMEVRGAGSYNGHLAWYRDRSAGALPDVWVLSLSLWVWRAVMLCWALWLSRSLLSWLKWAWQELNADGFWVPKPPRPAPSDRSPDGHRHTAQTEAPATTEDLAAPTPPSSNVVPTSDS